MKKKKSKRLVYISIVRSRHHVIDLYFYSNVLFVAFYAVEFARGTLIARFTFTDVCLTLYHDLVRLTGQEK